MVGALGVVFGDIGTSPIYTVQTVFNPGLIFWTVTIIVTLTSAELAAAAVAGDWPFVGDSTVIWCSTGDTITPTGPAAAVASSTI